ncbi:MAG: DUF4340 domain-containing protein [Acidiferrobacteraceae bacterium]|jgi:hypothetical protein
MNRRWLLNSILLLAIAGLTALAVWRPGLKASAPKPRLTTLDPRKIQHVRIEQPNRHTIVLADHNGHWYMDTPVGARAHAFNTARVLRVAMARVQKELPLSVGKDLAQFGLAKPRAVLQLDDQRIAFGGTNPVNDLQYVQYQGRIYLVAGRNFQDVARTYSDFLDAHLFRQDLKPVALYLPGLNLKLKDGRWIVRPASDKLTTDRINTFVDEWRYAQALTVEKYQGKPVHQQIRFRFAPDKKGGKPATVVVDILSRHGELVLYRPDEGLEYHFPEEVGKRLLELKPD